MPGTLPDGGDTEMNKSNLQGAYVAWGSPILNRDHPVRRQHKRHSWVLRERIQETQQAGGVIFVKKS